MLLEFRTSNYKSFKEELIFSLIPAPKQKGLDYSVLKQDIDKKKLQRPVFCCNLWFKRIRENKHHRCNGYV